MENYYQNLCLEPILYQNSAGEECVEKWIDIPNYENKYQISNLGRIKTLSREVSNSVATQITKEKILKQLISNSNPYIRVVLSSEGKKKMYLVHRLVAISFLNYNPKKNKNVIDHINNIKKDNRLDNLQIISIRENSSKDSRNKNGYVGVLFNKNKYTAYILVNSKQHCLGTYKSAEEASKVYNEAIQLIKENKSISHLIVVRTNLNGLKGVVRHGNTFQSKIYFKGNTISLGFFKTAEEAHNIYLKALELKRNNKCFLHLIKKYTNKLNCKGVQKYGNKFRTRVWLKGKNINLGVYDTLEEANNAYQEYKKKPD
jgi:hypothetical protein